MIDFDDEEGGWECPQCKALCAHTPLDELLGASGGVDWVICGGESGAGARPMHPDWARSLRDQCAAAGVPFFMKQMNIAGKLVKAMPDFPEDIRRREFPNAV